MKNFPNYITKNWQYRSWLTIGVIATCYFSVVALTEPAAAVFVVGFAFMNARLIVKRRKWKKNLPTAGEKYMQDLKVKLERLEMEKRISELE